MFEYQDFSFTASFSGPDMTGAVHFDLSAESFLYCMLQNGKPVGDGRYKTSHGDEWYFKWSDLPNWEQIQSNIPLGELVQMAWHGIECLSGMA